MRRWGRANWVTHLGTLTNRDVVRDWREMERRKERFLERMHQDGFDIPIALVAEPHPGGHGWHIQFGAPCFIDIRRLQAWWPYGKPYICTRKDRRAIAKRKGGVPGYISKYITKQLDAGELYGCDPRPAGAKRWWHTRGTEPTRVTYERSTLWEIARLVRRVYGEMDEEIPIGRDEGYRPEGYWWHFPDHCCRPPP